MSQAPFVSPATRLVASDVKATKRPSAEIDGAAGASRSPASRRSTRSRARRAPLPVAHEDVLSRRSCRPPRGWRRRTRRRRSGRRRRSTGRRSSRSPAPRRWTRSRARSCPSERSRTKMSQLPFVSPATRLEAWDWKATKRPSAEIDGRARSGVVRLLPGAGHAHALGRARASGRARRRRPRRSCRPPRGWRPGTRRRRSGRRRRSTGEQESRGSPVLRHWTR